MNTLKASIVSGLVNHQGKYPYDVIIVNVMRHWTVVSLGCSWMQWMNSDTVTSTVKASCKYSLIIIDVNLDSCMYSYIMYHHQCE